MKIRINGKEVEVKDGDSVEVPAEEAETPAAPSDEDNNEEGEKGLEARAKALGKQIADEVAASLDINDVKGIKAKTDRMMDMFFGNDSKLKSILNGKDLFGGEELTKEEKILGFYHALVTNNEPALKALAEGTDADGGYLFPNEFMTELVRELPEINVMRNWVRIIPMRRNKMDITNLVSGPKVTWTLENETKSTTTARFNQSTLTAYKMAAILYSSDELIEDSDIFDVVQMIIGLFGEAIAEEEEKVIWTGNGTSQPQGLETARAASTISSIAASGQDADDLITLFHAVPRKYRVRSAWFMNDNTAKNIRKLKDNDGQYLWQRSLQEGDPATIEGRPVIISDWAPNNTIFFGDLRSAYFLGDRRRMTAKVSQETETAFTKDQTAIRVVSRIGGLVVLPNAVRALTGF